MGESRGDKVRIWINVPLHYFSDAIQRWTLIWDKGKVDIVHKMDQFMSSMLVLFSWMLV
jgi:hypothetical protein